MTAATGTRIIIPMVPDATLNPNARVHWARRAKAVRELRRAAWASAYDARGAFADQPLAVEACICWPRGRKRLDADNATACIKAALDGLTDAGVWWDDRSIERLTVTQARLDATGRAHHPHGCVIVDIDALAQEGTE